MKAETTNVEELHELTQKFLRELSHRPHADTNRACVVGLKGDLGAGKTTFVKAVSSTLGIPDTVTSPTFVIEKVYKLPAATGPFSRLIHIDAYRLREGADLLALGWKEIAADPENLIFIEWPEHVEEVLPEDIKIIRFAFIDEHTRKIEMEK